MANNSALVRMRGPAMARLARENNYRTISSFEEAMSKFENTNFQKTVPAGTLRKWVTEWCIKKGIEVEGTAPSPSPVSTFKKMGRPSKSNQAEAFRKGLLEVVTLVRDLAGRMELTELNSFAQRLEALGGLQAAESLLEVAQQAAAVLGTSVASNDEVEEVEDDFPEDESSYEEDSQPEQPSGLVPVS